jgi:threonine dehydrogenase-like Zn-dependent dehydrogenase
MKAVRGRQGAPVVVDLDEAPGHGELLSMRAAGICASDLMYLRIGTDRVLGHELAGVREDGTPVVLEGLFGCGDCAYCLGGRNNLCPSAAGQALGIGQDGGMVEHYRQPPNKLVPLPAGLDVADAPLVEPASVSWHGIRRGDVTADKRVAVIGGGSIGQLAAAATTAQGAGEVALEARHPHQHEIRERLGFAEPAGLYDVVVEAAGSTSAIQRSVERACSPRSSPSPPRWATAAIPATARCRTPRRCSPIDPRSPPRSSPTVSRSRTQPKHSASRPTAPPEP